LLEGFQDRGISLDRASPKRDETLRQMLGLEALKKAWSKLAKKSST